MSAMSPIALQDDISATSAALPSKYHYTSANETLKGPGMAAGTVTFQEPNLKVQGPLAPSPGIVTFYEPSLELQKPVAPPPGTVDFQEPNLKVQGSLAPPQISALSNDVLQSQGQSGTSLTTTPSAVNWTTTGPMKQAVQGANVAHQAYSSPIPAMHPFNIPTPNLVSYPGQGLPTPLPPCPGPGHILYVSTSSGNIGVPSVAPGPPMQDVSYPCNSSDTKREIGTIYPQLLTPVVTSTPLSTVVTQNERERSRKKL